MKKVLMTTRRQPARGLDSAFSTVLKAIALTFLTASASAEGIVDGDVEAGKAKSITCSACHGAEGISANPLWPNLAGQGAPYIVAQLRNFKEGRRNNALMNAQAMLLSDQDMNDLAAYFASLPPAVQSVANESLVDRAEALYRGGHSENGVPACLACHGPQGRGNAAAAYPALNGQHATYTNKTLGDYASGERKSDGQVQIMRTISQRLTPEDREALASYLQGLR
ncbi:MAG: c-type cytochrome [Pseudomonadota bacterium]